MTLTILTGPPGSGKSKQLIATVEAARSNGRAVRTFLARKAVVGAHDPNLWMHGVIASRDPQVMTPLDHLVSADECGEILRDLPPGSLAAFDEAFHFDSGVADHWSRAAARGIDVLVATPSDEQLERLVGENVTEKRMRMRCQRCGRREANEAFLMPGETDATSVCDSCAEEIVSATRAELVSRLRRQAPYPGEKALYQPVELEECADWQVLRPDSATRVELLTSLVDELEARTGTRPESYLDVGCNTGYFCSAMASLGLAAVGVDVVEDDIDVARLLSATIRRDRCQFIVDDVYDYLRDPHGQTFDVVSAFSVIQWLILQRTLEHGVEALQLLFEKSARACVLEMGYPSEEIYREKLPDVIDRDWVHGLMVESGCFEEVRCIPAGQGGLMRDVFVGFVGKPAARSRPTEPAISDASPEPHRRREDIVRRAAPVIRGLLQGESAGEHFRSWEEEGIHVTPVSFYHPIPEVRKLPESLWARQSSFGGIDLNEDAQVRLVSKELAAFAGECASLPAGEPGSGSPFFVGNGMFDGTDAMLYYCLVRHVRPKRIVEVGSGFSTALALLATRENGGAEVVAIDPYPSKAMVAVKSDLASMIELPVQEVDPMLFERLDRGDILFIDSSHVTQIASDVNFLVLEILPRLNEGVLIHFHDVFLPFEYPRDWVVDKLRFWNEQYLLQAFLAFNSDFEVLLTTHLLGVRHRDLLRQLFPTSPWWGGGSFWIQRRERRRAVAGPRRRHT